MSPVADEIVVIAAVDPETLTIATALYEAGAPVPKMYAETMNVASAGDVNIVTAAPLAVEAVEPFTVENNPPMVLVALEAEPPALAVKQKGLQHLVCESLVKV